MSYIKRIAITKMEQDREVEQKHISILCDADLRNKMEAEGRGDYLFLINKSAKEFYGIK
jgi:hypothetical protein